MIAFWMLAAFSGASASAQSGGGWKSLAEFPSARQEVAAAVLNGKIFVLGGFDGEGRPSPLVEVYNPNTNTWSAAAPLPFGNDHLGAAVAAGKLYAFGGLSRDTFVYDPKANSWTFVARMNSTHGGTPAVGVIDDKIYCAGGVSGGTSLPVLEVFDPATNTWSTRASMSVARDHTAGAVINGRFYVAAGRGSRDSATALEVYDPAANSWSRRASMPTGRSGVAAAGVNGELYVFGGETDRIHGEVEVYNPASNSWRRLPEMPTPRHGISAAVIGDRIYLPGGATVPGFGGTTVNEVFTVERRASFANISSRLKVQTGDNVLIAGFIVTGSGSKRIVVRGIGPSLDRVAGALADPVLELNGPDGPITSNDNWRDAPNREEIADSTLAPPRDAEPAILTQLAPGAYTAVVRGRAETSGIGLVEVYDLEAGSPAQLANISTRGLVETGENVLIGGLILTGTEPRRVILRAIGPSLSVAGTMADPKLALHDANGEQLTANDNWRSDQEAEIQGTGLPPANDLESAIVRTLPPGVYTAIVRGVNDSTGIALVEAYALD